MHSEDIVQIRDGYIWVNGNKIPLLSGEFHFWRNTKKFWPRILNSIKDLGFKHITTYVEWNFHRITPDGTPIGEIEYDFHGETDQQTDLAGYLDYLQNETDLWLTIRPGPYIYAETEFEGPPKEAAELHRNHPIFLKLADDYIKHVAAVIKPHLVTNGGNILMCQLDNECSMIKHQNQVLDLPLEDPCSFRAFIKQEYGTFESAARRYGLEEEWEEWADVAPMPAMPINEKEFLLYVDTARYLEWYDALYFKRIADMYSKYGIDVPFYINSTGPPFPHDPKLLDDFVALRTADIYYLKKNRLINMLALNAKILKATSPAVVAGEFRAGTFSGTTMKAKMYKYQALMWMMYGFHGVNYFMIVERHRWPTPPIDAVGRPYIAYNTFKKICGLYNKIDYPRFTAHAVCDINLMWYRPHAFANKRAPMEPGFDMKNDYPNNLLFKSLLRANIPFDIWYPGHDLSSIDTHPYLICAGHNFLAPDIAEEILRYAKNGGTVIFPYSFPVKTIDDEPMDVFVDCLYPPQGVLRTSGNHGVSVGYSTVGINTEVLVEYSILDDEDGITPIKYKHMDVGYIKKVGKGRIAVLGFDLDQKNIGSVLKLSGWNQFFKINAKHTLATLFHIPDTNELLLTLLNYEDDEEHAAVSLNLSKLGLTSVDDVDGWLVESLFDDESFEKETIRRLTFTVEGKSGEMVYIRPV